MNSKKHFSERQIINIGIQISEAMIYLHKNGIIHRDLKPDNILIFENETVKVGDFGISKEVDQNSLATKHEFGTSGYQAPEILVEGDKKYTRMVDVYSFGLIL